MYLLPQEIEVWYIIPMVRKTLAKQFVNDYGFSYEKAGKILGVSKAAVSQYMNNKRANKIKLSKDTIDELKISAGIIAEDPRRVIKEIERILTFMKVNKSSCNVCKKYNKDILDYCNAEPMY